MKKFILFLLVMIGQCSMQASGTSAEQSLDYLKGYNAGYEGGIIFGKRLAELNQKMNEPQSSIVNAGVYACRFIIWYGILNSIWNEKITFSKMDAASVLIPFYFMVLGDKKFQTIGLGMTAVNIARIIGNKINAYKAKDEESEEDVQITTVEKS